MSENIFAEIYNRILGLFGQAAPKEDSKDVAVNRLRLVLMQDRTNLTPEILQRMRKELIELLSKYVELDKEALELNFEQEGEQMALMLSIPVIRAKDEAEIEAALKEADEKAAKEESEDEDTEDEENSEDAAEESSQETPQEGEASEGEENNQETPQENNDQPQEGENTEGEEAPQGENAEQAEQSPEDYSEPKKKSRKKTEEQQN